MTAPFDIDAAADWIEALQDGEGAISWIETGLWDPWNQVESALGLLAAGRTAAAVRAFEHLAKTQEADGGWTADLGAAAPMDADNRRLVPSAPRLKETNFAAWTAVGVWGLHLAGVPAALERFGPLALAGCKFAVAHQRPFGEIAWRIPDGEEDADSVDALLAANCAIFKALDCAARIAAALRLDTDPYRAARARLGSALRRRPELFAPKPAHAMDWYYPVLAGVLTGAEAAARLDSRWRAFVAPDHGCRCISDQPWATAAETAELAIACLAAGRAGDARALLARAGAMQRETGGLWMGRQFEMEIWWPEEAPSWTAGAALIAADAILGLSPAGALFRPGGLQPIRSSSISEPMRSTGSNRPEARARR